MTEIMPVPRNLNFTVLPAESLVGEIDDGHENLAEDQMYFEFCTGEQI